MRLAKRIAESGVASRREAERLIEAGRIMVDGQVVKTPVFFVTDASLILIDGKSIPPNSEEIIIWKFYKPRGVITTKKDPQDRKTVFDFLKHIDRRLLYIGRLDYNSEGLLLFTNNGKVAQKMELPSTGLKRVYRARVIGHISEEKIQILKNGVIIEGIKYRVFEIKMDERQRGQANFWISMTLQEGKNREVRKVMEYVGCSVNRLIRISYGPFSLGNLPPGDVQQAFPLETKKLLNILKFR
ncbi:MAG: rRNA pseudouridine synthase [Holosporaceae bacterium]|jgi:23S rRNA pseudouridine2605 synthase|nr:rRNA pseudouridine synthase [Holosporaceae bacterium]